VDDAPPVQVSDRLQRLARELHAEGHGRRAVGAKQVTQVDPFDVFHDHERRAVLVDHEVVEHRDVGVLQTGRVCASRTKRLRSSSLSAICGRITLMTRSSFRGGGGHEDGPIPLP